MNAERPTLVRVITWLPVGGIERRLVAVAPRLRDLGWNVRVVCLKEEGPLGRSLRDSGIPVDVIRMQSRLSPRGIRALARYFREHRARVVHAHMYRSNIPATIAGRLAGVPAIFGQIHNVDSWDSWRQRLTERVVAGWRTGTLAVSAAVQRDVMTTLRLPVEKVPVLYNGIDVEAFRPDAEARRQVRRELGVDENKVLLLAPARLHPQKNPMGVLEAFEAMAKDRPGGALLAFAGTGKLEDELRARASASPVRESIRVLGERHDMAALYNGADAVVLSSFKEGFSNAVVEALACGRPVIASDVGGNREAAPDSRYGWIHDAGDGPALARQMREAVERGTEELAAMGSDCRARAECFSIDAMVERTNALYREALDLPIEPSAAERKGTTT